MSKPIFSDEVYIESWKLEFYGKFTYTKIIIFYAFNAKDPMLSSDNRV